MTLCQNKAQGWNDSEMSRNVQSEPPWDTRYRAPGCGPPGLQKHSPLGREIGLTREPLSPVQTVPSRHEPGFCWEPLPSTHGLPRARRLRPSRPSVSATAVNGRPPQIIHLVTRGCISSYCAAPLLTLVTPPDIRSSSRLKSGIRESVPCHLIE